MILSGWDIASYKSGVFFLDLETVKFKSILIDIKSQDLYERLRLFKERTTKLLELYTPDLLVVESTYLDDWRKHKNTKKRGNVNTLKILEKFHGVLLANTKDYMDIHYMAPSEHKEALTGIGNAGKQATIYSVQRILGLVDMGSDEADAAALAIAYLVKHKQWDILEKIKQKYKS
jgi:Holliday junction resolvasome RuvABC endonuclease subunit